MPSSRLWSRRCAPTTATRAGSEPALSLDLTPFQVPAAAVADIVDVVIPVYRGHDETVACIESVIASANATRCEIVVVDDCTPDPRLRAALREFERSGAITLVTNPANLGFPASANAGMSLHPDRDVILLNADTLVPRRWVDRLREAAYRHGNIGSVTPLSNRATICSYPEINRDNELPGDIAWEELDQICAEVNAGGAAVELPTAVGFCAYLKRAMLREVGLLNAERWKRGYGEENELCILAAARGWKHVMAPNLFVVHHGAVSFGKDGRKAGLETNLATLNRLYPDYFPRVMEFLREDPAAPARRAIDWARLRRLSTRFMLFVSHRYGGGIAVHVEDMARRLAAEDCHVLILEANADNRGSATIRNLTLGTRSVYALPREVDALVADLRASGVWHIHFHHIMGGQLWAALPGQLGCPYDVTVHDYSFFCPRIDLIDEQRHYCGEPAVEVCERCIALNLPHPQLQGAFRDRGGLPAWLALHRSLLAGARRVFAPSRDVAARMARHVPGVDYAVRHHPEPARGVAIRRPASSVAARVAVIGAIGANKGYDLLLGCARDALKQDLPIEFRLFGFAANDTPLRLSPMCACSASTNAPICPGWSRKIPVTSRCSSASGRKPTATRCRTPMRRACTRSRCASALWKSASPRARPGRCCRSPARRRKSTPPSSPRSLRPTAGRRRFAPARTARISSPTTTAWNSGRIRPSLHPEIETGRNSLPPDGAKFSM